MSTVEICVSPTGSVTRAAILKSSTPIVDRQLPAVLARWRYRPLLIEDQPTSFCYVMNYRVQSVPGKKRTGWLF